LALRKTAVTSFTWQNEKHNVRQAEASIFDAWIRQYVETISDVDTTTWDKFHRWQIINTVLQAGLLFVVEEEDGTCSLRARQDSEVKSSAVELAGSDNVQTEAQRSGDGAKSAELQTSVPVVMRAMQNLAEVAPILDGWLHIIKGTLETKVGE
jgi:hypothetical protein